MPKRFFLVGTLAFGSIWMGCASAKRAEDATAQAANATGDKADTTPQAQGGTDACDAAKSLSAQAYFDRFLYKDTGMEKQADGTAGRYRFAGTQSFAAAPFVAGRHAQISIYLLDGGQYKGHYAECADQPDGSCADDGTKAIDVAGTYKVEGESLTLDLGTAARIDTLDVNGKCQPAMSLVYNRDLVSAGLKDKSDILVVTYAAAAPSGL